MCRKEAVPGHSLFYFFVKGAISPDVKIQKGVLKDFADDQGGQTGESGVPEPVTREAPAPAAAAATTASNDASRTPAPVQKDRLFETLEKERSGSRNYAKLFLIAVVLVVAIGGVTFYLTLPGPGDVVHAPNGAEDAVRAQLLEKQKREAEDIVFYYCGKNSYWARADVKTRKDVPNPVFKIGKYAATIKGEDPNWEVSSKPIVNAEDDNPCS